MKEKRNDKKRKISQSEVQNLAVGDEEVENEEHTTALVRRSPRRKNQHQPPAQQSNSVAPPQRRERQNRHQPLPQQPNPAAHPQRREQPDRYQPLPQQSNPGGNNAAGVLLSPNNQVPQPVPSLYPQAPFSFPTFLPPPPFLMPPPPSAPMTCAHPNCSNCHGQSFEQLMRLNQDIHSQLLAQQFQQNQQLHNQHLHTMLHQAQAYPPPLPLHPSQMPQPNQQHTNVAVQSQEPDRPNPVETRRQQPQSEQVNTPTKSKEAKDVEPPSDDEEDDEEVKALKDKVKNQLEEAEKLRKEIKKQEKIQKLRQISQLQEKTNAVLQSTVNKSTVQYSDAPDNQQTNSLTSSQSSFFAHPTNPTNQPLAEKDQQTEKEQEEPDTLACG